MSNTNKIKLGFMVVPAVGLIGGCQSMPMDEAKIEVSDNIKSAKSKSEQLTRVSSSAVVSKMVDDYYIVGGKFDVEDRKVLPSFFREVYSFNQIDPVTLSELVSFINKATNVKIDVTSDAVAHLNGLTEESSESTEEEFEVGGLAESYGAIDVNINDYLSDQGSGLAGSNVMFSVNFEGTLEDFLNHVLGRVNLSWDWKGGYIEIYHLKEKTFTLDSDLANLSYSAAISGGSVGGQDFSMANDLGSLYDEVKETISNLASDNASFSVSKQLSTVTILDTPMNLKRVERYIKSLNASARKQIILKVQVIDIESDDSGKYGIDWDSVFSNSSRVSGGINSSFIMDGEGVFDISLLDGAFSSTSALINALSTETNISTTINTNIHTSNGRPVPVSIGEKVDYVEKMERVEASVEGGSESYLPTPATMETGFLLNILPRINSTGDISMTMSLDISDGFIDERNIEGGGMIGLPNKSNRTFIQRAVSKNGNPLMLAGFERDTSTSVSSSIAGDRAWLLGGKKEGGKKKVMTMVFITPYIVK